VNLGLEGRRALVLGASSGLGRAVAEALAAEGARVAVAGRDAARVDAAARAVGGVGLTADLEDPSGPAEVVDGAARALGGLDIAVVNTGGGTPGGLASGTDAAAIAAADDADEQAYSAMLRPALRVARRAAPLLAAGGAADPGRLVFVTARSVLEATPELARSSVFRSGVAAAARSLALELAPGVLVNVVVPGQFATPAYSRFAAWVAEHEGVAQEEVHARHRAAIPLGRLGRAEELAGVVAFLAGAAASYVTGTVVRVDGGAVRGF
jgi:3-oxoacyl-[acyl-carrier protein] reductase